MADFVKYQLGNGTEVYFETAEASLVAARGRTDPDVVDQGPIADRLQQVALAAEEVSESLRSRLSPDQIELTFGVKVSGEAGWWFFAKAGGEANIQVTLRWGEGQP